jgi:CubicO group peptidase (beta-lactamase class C family)
MDSGMINKMTNVIVTGEYPNIHSVLIAKNGKLVYEKYFPGKDEILGESIGVVNHHKDTLHDIRSVTKSVVSACIGIAISQGKIKNVEQKIWDYFPEYNELSKGQKSNLTIKHLLTMSSGLEWNENIPYTDPNNSEIQMDQSSDAIQFVLSRNSVHPPGTVWNYNGGTTQVLAAIIKKVSGLEVDEYANKYLFTPLGIAQFVWLKFPNSSTRKDVPLAAAGLRLRSRDLLKFGFLYMNKGVWHEKQILPENWVSDSHKSHINRDGGGYGYQFWIFKENLNNQTIELPVAVGNGDQRILFDHKNDLLVVTTAGNYNQWTIKNNTGALLTNFIYPSFLTSNR